MNITHKYMRAIGKAASALRFNANNNERLTKPAKEELLQIADDLTELETNIFLGQIDIVDSYMSKGDGPQN